MTRMTTAGLALVSVVWLSVAAMAQQAPTQSDLIDYGSPARAAFCARRGRERKDRR
jgi:hypothetical protein